MSSFSSSSMGYQSTYTSRAPTPAFPTDTDLTPTTAAPNSTTPLLSSTLSSARQQPYVPPRKQQSMSGLSRISGLDDDESFSQQVLTPGMLAEDTPFFQGIQTKGSGDLEEDLQEGSKSRRLMTFRTRSKYYIPVLSWLPTYNLELFTGDVVAGITLTCLLIPQGISYASQLAKLSPISGLYCSAVPAIIYALLGTCRQLSIGPEAALCLLIGNTIQEIIGHMDRDVHNPLSDAAKQAIGVDVATAIGWQVGLITFGLGIFRLGFLDVVLSRALLKGFITAVAVIISIEQLGGMLGLSQKIAALPLPHTTVSKVAFLATHVSETHCLTAIISFSTFAFLFVTKATKKLMKDRRGFRWLKFVPEIFVGVVITTLLARMYRWDLNGLQVLGKIESLAVVGGGSVAFPVNRDTLKFFIRTFSTSAVISVIGFVDSIVSAKEQSGKFGYSISPNRELVALGASNIASSFFPGLVPAFGSVTRSRLNGETGARTQMAGLVSAFCIFVAISFLLPSLFYLPKCVLAAVVFMVIIGIIIEAPHEIRFYLKVSAWQDLTQFTGTFLLTLFVGVEPGLVASVAFSLILVVQNSTQTRIKILGHVRGAGDKWAAIDENPEAEEDIPGVLVIRIRESLNFANTGQLKERLRRLELYGPSKAHPSEAPRRTEANVIVIHMSDVEYIDASALAIFEEIAISYRARGVPIFFTHLRPTQKELFVKAGLVNILGPAQFQDDVASAINIIESIGLGSSASNVPARA
ncbi:Sulfate/bicarbonate/oxalate exchanger SAT-1 and related transporters (SLC26 family) [Phaffia rhodozyma]|uniref:Sulfate/bicarbonate/oxalate exchanger SAT-1 and related transporters (SLC26 family) n=1 Tax=Phaffia rhodozyma TaxID=264483 RepID=A0A0F7SUH7_PHARH|nr:Sulfate/bicarbonate/oxalate exchanger SAT-1 and related transporters (SLC26 family) [Phaffia rhodozyma]